MIFKASEVGKNLDFDVIVDSQEIDLTATGIVLTLEVAGNPRSPFSLVPNVPRFGQARYKLQAGDFSVGVYTAIVRLVDPTRNLVSEDFTITVE